MLSSPGVVPIPNVYLPVINTNRKLYIFVHLYIRIIYHIIITFNSAILYFIFINDVEYVCIWKSFSLFLYVCPCFKGPFNNCVFDHRLKACAPWPNIEQFVHLPCQRLPVCTQVLYSQHGDYIKCMWLALL